MFLEITTNVRELLMSRGDHGGEFYQVEDEVFDEVITN